MPNTGRVPVRIARRVQAILPLPPLSRSQRDEVARRGRPTGEEWSPGFKKWDATDPDHFDTPSGRPRHLFSKPIGPQAWLNREYVPHIAAYAKAVIGHG